MAEHKDDIIREQADVIEDLQEELMQVYAQLHEKEKRKAKREPDSEDDASEKKRAWIPVYLRLVWWYFFQPNRMDEFKQNTKKTGEYHTSWQLTAFLIYGPLVCGIIGFMLGAVPARVDFPIRFGAGLILLVVVGLAWLATAELRRYKDVARSNWAAFLSSVIVTFTICLLTLVGKGSPGVNWLLVMVGLVFIPNSALRRLIMARLELPKPDAPETYDYPLWIASGIILEASILAVVAQGDSFDFMTWMLVGSPFAAFIWIIVLHVASQLFMIGFPLLAVHDPSQAVRYKVDLIFLRLAQGAMLLLLAGIYGGLIVMMFYGRQIYGP